MTSTITASALAVFGLAALTWWHLRGWHRDRDTARRLTHERIQAQLDRTRDYPTGYMVDAEYRALLEAGRPYTNGERGGPFDWEAEGAIKAAAMDVAHGDAA